MLKIHYLKVAVRNIIKFRLQTVVCITGLAVGMACFALGTLWLRHIESYEDFVPDADRVFFVTTGKDPINKGYGYLTWRRDAEKLQEARAEIEECVHCMAPYFTSNACFDDGEESREFRGLCCDEAFIRLFGIKAEAGTIGKLAENDIILTRSMARKYFGEDGNGDAALGKTLKIIPMYDEYGIEEYTVKAIVPDCPRNTQVYYEALMPFYYKEGMDADGTGMYYTFAKTKPGAALDSLVGHEIDICFQSGGYLAQRTFELAPIRKWRTDYPDAFVKISTDYVRWFMLLGLLVIGCSLCNYLITMVSHLRRRSWEMSLRRVLGSSRASIINMVCVETLLMFVLSAVAGLLLTWLVLPYFREYSDIDLPLSSIALTLCGYLSLVIVCGMALSALTAWTVMWRTQRNILSSRQLKHSSTLLDRFGVMLQMALSFGILFCVAVMLRQMNMVMYSDELGFSHNDRGMTLAAPEEIKRKIMESPLVEEAFEGGEPILPRLRMMSIRFFKSEEDVLEGKKPQEVEVIMLDSAIVRFYGLQLLTGRMCDMKNDNHEACVNEAMCKALGCTPEKAIGQTVYCYGDHRTVCGVLKDIYTLGPASEPKPTIFYDPQLFESEQPKGRVFFRTKPGRLAELCDSLNKWGDECPELKFGLTVFNIEERFNEYVASERMLIKILLAVGLCSLFVCVIGTFSLVSLSLQQRRKEIAVRKVHGARVKDIIPLFIKSNVLSLLIAALLAYPLSYMLMRTWLNGYLKQVEISWWLFALTFLTVAVVVLSTIALKIWRAAKENPASKLHE